MTKPILILSTDRILSWEQREAMQAALAPLAQRLGMEPVIADPGIQVTVQRDMQPLVDAVEAQTAAINQLIAVLSKG